MKINPADKLRQGWTNYKTLGKDCTFNASEGHESAAAKAEEFGLQSRDLTEG